MGLGKAGAAVNRELGSVLVWTAGFLLLELPAKDVFGVWPWYSLSVTVENGVSWWWVIAVYVPVFMAVLLGHFELGWSAKWVILMGLLGAALVTSRLLRWL